MVSRLLHLMIIDILTTGVALRLGSAKLRPMLQEIKKNLRANLIRPSMPPALRSLRELAL
jgi:DNA-binding MurR/RpiR family transcriptional regulator